MNEEFKMALVIRSFNRGGAEVLIRETFESAEFHKNIKDCDLIILDGKRTELLKDLNGINYYIFNLFSASFFEFFREYHNLYKLIKKKKYKIVHTHLPVAGIALRFLKFFNPKFKLVYTEHSIVDRYNKFTYYLNGLTYFKNDFSIFVSKAIKDNINVLSNRFFYFYKKGAVVFNGVNSDKYYCPFKNGSFLKDYLTVGTVTNMRKEKRLDCWIEVAEIFKEKYQDIPVKFIIAGDGSEKKAIEELISSKRLNDYITLTGLIINTVSVYNDIDIFLMTSSYEGMPVALLEAMSCACIPITSNVGGIRNLNFNNFGYKYENFNAENLAKVILQYYNDKNKIVEERKRAREFVLHNSSLDKQMNEYINIYKGLQPV